MPARMLVSGRDLFLEEGRDAVDKFAEGYGAILVGIENVLWIPGEQDTRITGQCFGTRQRVKAHRSLSLSLPQTGVN